MKFAHNKIAQNKPYLDFYVNFYLERGLFMDEIIDKNELRQQAKPLIFDGIYKKAQEALDTYIDELGVKKLYVDPQVPQKIANNLQDDVLDEFMSLDETNEETLQEDIKDFLEDNYDVYFLQMEVERYEDEDKIRENLENDFVLAISNADPYAKVAKGYWVRKAHDVRDLRELQRYMTDEAFDTFVETYAPDWEEAAK